MKVSLLSAVILVAAFAGVPANAQQSGSQAPFGIYDRPVDPKDRERDWHDFGKYDYDRPERGQPAYYAERYYRDWRYYGTRSLARADRIYRGGSMQYYCRRPDGTTGKVEGLVGHVRSDILAPRGSSLVADLIDRGEARLAAQVDRGKLVCR